MATVWVPSLLREFTGGLDRIDVPGRTLRQVVRGLDERFPGFAARVIQDEGFGDITVVVDGATVTTGLMEPVEENSEINFLPNVSGGMEI
jgi:molybdopterin synthase sulfur carrier subunit